MSNSIKGAKELMRKFKAMSNELKAPMCKNAVLAGALPIVNDAKDRARVKTGTMKRSIHSEIIEERDDFILASIGTPTMSDGKNMSYAWYVEFKYPFLRPAFDSQRNAAVKEVQAALYEQLTKAIK